MFFFKLQKLKKQARSFHLSLSEKELMQNNISAFMKNNPVRKRNDVRQVSHKTEPSSVFSFLHRKYMFASIASIILVLLSGGVSYAAESSTPGQPLYAVKQFNEEVKLAVTLSPEKKAEWNARRVERRLEEATNLASSGKLTTTTQAIITAALNNNLKEVEQKLEHLESEGKSEKASEVGKRLVQALQVHEKLIVSLNVLQNDSDDTTTSTATVSATSSSPQRYDKENENEMGNDKNQSHKNELVRDIKKQINEIVKITNKLEKIAESENKNESSAKGKITSAENKINEVKKFIELKSPTMSVETKTKATASLTVAQNELATAKLDLANKKYVESFEHAKKAHLLAEEAKFIIVTQQKIETHINVGKILNDNENREKMEKSFSTTTFSIGSSTSSTLNLKKIEKRIEKEEKRIEKIEEQRENKKENIERIKNKINEQEKEDSEMKQQIQIDTKIQNRLSL